MDIKELAKILQRCSEAGSVDELIRAAGGDDAVGADGVKIKISFTKEDKSEVDLKLYAEGDVDKMSFDELEEYLEDLEFDYDELECEEPEDFDSEEHEIWDEKLTELENKKDAIEAKIAELKSGN